mmetsp:Transcript_49358/g.127348  ORF Transcript_49358/g.127348 Transcript_49358/m.127348 type:complete len:241 (-) Transcript_49358:78-800(-)
MVFSGTGIVVTRVLANEAWRLALASANLVLASAKDGVNVLRLPLVAVHLRSLLLADLAFAGIASITIAGTLLPGVDAEQAATTLVSLGLRHLRVCRLLGLRVRLEILIHLFARRELVRWELTWLKLWNALAEELVQRGALRVWHHGRRRRRRRTAWAWVRGRPRCRVGGEDAHGPEHDHTRDQDAYPEAERQPLQDLGVYVRQNVVLRLHLLFRLLARQPCARSYDGLNLAIVCGLLAPA